MAYNIYENDKLIILGQDAVSKLKEEVVTQGLLDDFANVLANLDDKPANKDMILSAREFDLQTDIHYLLFHLITLGTAFLKSECHEYIMRKKFFGGYEEDIYDSMFFIEGLGNGLQQFKAKEDFSKQQIIIAEDIAGQIRYTYGESLSTMPIPYFRYESLQNPVMDSISEEIRMQFAQNMAYLRMPRHPEFAVNLFYEKSLDLFKITKGILEHFFIQH